MIPAPDELGTIRLQEGRGVEASELFEQALARHTAEGLYYKLSPAQASTGRDEQARRTIDNGLDDLARNQSVMVVAYW